MAIYMVIKLSYTRNALKDYNDIVRNLKNTEESLKDKNKVKYTHYIIMTYTSEIQSIANTFYDTYCKNIHFIQKYFDDRKLIGKISLIDIIILSMGIKNAKKIIDKDEYRQYKEWINERNKLAHSTNPPSKHIDEFVSTKVIENTERLLRNIDSILSKLNPKSSQ